MDNHGPVDIRKIRILVSLSRLGTMSAVARATGYGTSAVSQQLAALEREAGVQLLEAAGRRVRLTPAGRRLVSHAEGILAAVAAAELDLAAAAEPSGLVRVAGYTTALRQDLLPAAAELASRYTALEIELQEREPAEVDELLEGRPGRSRLRLRLHAGPARRAARPVAAVRQPDDAGGAAGISRPCPHRYRG